MPSLCSIFRKEHLFAFRSKANHFLVNQKSKRCGWQSYMARATHGGVVVNLTLLCGKLLSRIMSPFDSNLINLALQAGPFSGQDIAVQYMSHISSVWQRAPWTIAAQFRVERCLRVLGR